MAPIADVETELLLERDALHLCMRACAQRRRAARGRRQTFWERVGAQEEEGKLWLQAQQAVWAEQRGLHEQACLQPLSTCVAELRRWQGVQRAAHERKCAQVRKWREVEQGNMQWEIFCARLAHDSYGALSAVPLTPEQVRVCDTAAAQQLQPRTKAKDPKTFVVVRAAAISPARPGSAGPVSARSTRGLSCSELCQTREQLDRLLGRMLSVVVAAAEGAESLGQPAASAPSAAPAPPMPTSPARRNMGASGGSAAAKMAQLGTGRCAAAAAVGRADRGADSADAALASLPGKRMPLFPRSMRLSSDCLAWLNITEHSASDPHVYFLAEEMEAPPLPRTHGGARRRSTAAQTRAIAERLAKSAEVAAISIAGADLRVLLPDDNTDGDDASHILHLRPASVEHLLAVDCLWPRMDPADRQILSSCYTPRDTPHACRLMTLYVPIAHYADADGTMSTARRLRPLNMHELQELLRIYVVRAPQPAAATLALPLIPAGDERSRELRTHDDDEVLHHVYCTLSPPSGGAGTAYVLQMVTRESIEAAAGQDEVAATPPPLVDLLPTLQIALTTPTTSIRMTGLQPLELTMTSLSSALAGAQKARNAHAELAKASQHAMADLERATAPAAASAASATGCTGSTGSARGKKSRE